MHSFLSDHVLVVYIMKLDAGYGYLATAAPRGGVLHWHQRERVHRRYIHPGCLALAFYIVAERGGEVRISERAVRLRHRCRLRHAGLRVRLTIGNNQGMGDVRYGSTRTRCSTAARWPRHEGLCAPTAHRPSIGHTKAGRSGCLHRPGARGDEDHVPERAGRLSFIFGCAIAGSARTLTIGNNQGMDAENGAPSVS